MPYNRTVSATSTMVGQPTIFAVSVHGVVVQTSKLTVVSVARSCFNVSL